MTTFDAGSDPVSGGRNDAEFRLNGDGSRWLVTRLPIVALLSGAALLIAGCQGVPVAPLGFGPPLDNMFGVLILLLVGAALYGLLAPRFKRRQRSNSFAAAESIARERYAKGEITETEYRQIVRNLTAR